MISLLSIGKNTKSISFGRGADTELLVITRDTLTKVHEAACQALVGGQKKDLDLVTAADVQIFDVMLVARSAEWSFDLKSAWVTQARWRSMVQQYIDPYRFDQWLEKSSEIGLGKRGISLLRTKEVKSHGGWEEFGYQETRRWGSCMIALSYAALPRPRLMLFSRTSYLGYLGALDLSVAWMAGRYLARRLGISIEEMEFVWQVQAIQFHYFKSLAYLFTHPKEDYTKILIKKTPPTSFSLAVNGFPALRGARTWMQKILKDDREGKTYGDTTYNTFRRLRRRYHAEVLGYDYAKQFEGIYHWKRGGRQEHKPEKWMKAFTPLPSVPIQELSFKEIGRP
jgi:hypothetical protein